MKALKVTGLAILALLALVLVLGLIAPKSFDLERSITISVSKEAVFPYVQYLEKQDSWSPWREMDPDMKTSLTGTDGTVGAVSTWEGEKAGKGSQTLALVRPFDRVETKVNFITPFESSADAYFELRDAGSGATEVVWGFRSPMPFPFNIMGLFMDMEKSVGADYEKGLSKLKVLVESSAQQPVWEVKETNIAAPRYYVGVRKTIPMTGISGFLTENFPKIVAAVEAARLEMAGAPSTLTFVWDEEKQLTDIVAAIPVKSKAGIKGFDTFEYHGGLSLLVDYYGPYEQIGSAYESVDAYVARKGWKQGTPVCEEYITDPGMEPDTAKWLTKVFVPVLK